VAAFYLDTSAAVKRYIQETGTAWLRNLADPAAGHYLYLARIADVEVTAAIARRRRQARIDLGQATAALTQFRKDMAQDYRILEITVPLLERAVRLADTHVLRAYDAVQLASALEVLAIDPGLTLISADAELNAAAAAEGLPVDDPNTHP